jgi:hypothetical protein
MNTSALKGVYYSNQKSSEAPAYYVTLDDARALRKAGKAFAINSGRDIRLIQEYVVQSVVEQVFGWNILGGMRRTALNEGRVGQFSIGYPVPYAFEGHLRMPRAAVINHTETSEAVTVPSLAT